MFKFFVSRPPAPSSHHLQTVIDDIDEAPVVSQVLVGIEGTRIVASPSLTSAESFWQARDMFIFKGCLRVL